MQKVYRHHIYHNGYPLLTTSHEQPQAALAVSVETTTELTTDYGQPGLVRGADIERNLQSLTTDVFFSARSKVFNIWAFFIRYAR